MPRTNSIRSIDLTRAILEHPETGAFFYVQEGRLTTVVAREIGLEKVKYKVSYIKDLVKINHKERLKNSVGVLDYRARVCDPVLRGQPVQICSR